MSRGADCQTHFLSLSVTIRFFLSGLNLMQQLHLSTGCTQTQACTHTHTHTHVCLQTQTTIGNLMPDSTLKWTSLSNTCTTLTHTYVRTRMLLSFSVVQLFFFQVNSKSLMGKTAGLKELFVLFFFFLLKIQTEFFFGLTESFLLSLNFHRARPAGRATVALKGLGKNKMSDWYAPGGKNIVKKKTFSDERDRPL